MQTSGCCGATLLSALSKLKAAVSGRVDTLIVFACLSIKAGSLYVSVNARAVREAGRGRTQHER